MLNRLTIKNLAIVSSAEIELSEGFNVLSGETGAGKSIIVDALMLLLGGRYDKTMLSYGETNGFVEGYFSFDDSIKEILNDYGVDCPDGEMIVRRKFSLDGKNEIRINGIAATTSMLKSIMSNLVDICGQNEYQILARKKEHRIILDGYCGAELSELLALIAAKVKYLSEIKKNIEKIGNASERLIRLDMLKYQIEEIEKANVSMDEEIELLEKRSKAMHSEKIRASLESSSSALDSENGAIEKLHEAIKSLYSLHSFGSEFAELYSRIENAEIEIADISATISDLMRSSLLDEEDIDKIEKRLAVVRNIKNKYGALDVLDKKLEKLKTEYDFLSNADEQYQLLQSEKEKCLDELFDLSKKASLIRKKNAEKFEKDILLELSTLGFKKPSFSIAFADFPLREEIENKISSNGADDVEFLLSPNPGQPLLPLIKIISGGEMSRFMLALKVVASKYSSAETMIFDEIDSGISGNTGLEVAKKLAVISRTNQVVCVTHLAQIASMADTHYYIEKSAGNDSTSTTVTKLDNIGILNEISRLSGSEGISSVSLKNAEELKNWAEDYKKTI